MSWVRIEDTFYAHPKVLETPLAAIGLHVLALCYSSAHLTDGSIRPGSLRYLHGTRTLAAALVKSGLWEVADDGWQIHDFLDYNLSKVQAIERRQHISQERSKAGSNGAARRWQTDRQSDNTTNAKAMAPSRPVLDSYTSTKTKPRVRARDPVTIDEQKHTDEDRQARYLERQKQRGLPV